MVKGCGCDCETEELFCFSFGRHARKINIAIVVATSAAPMIAKPPILKETPARANIPKVKAGDAINEAHKEVKTKQVDGSFPVMALFINKLPTKRIGKATPATAPEAAVHNGTKAPTPAPTPVVIAVAPAKGIIPLMCSP